MEQVANTSGWLIARITMAYVFLYAAWLNTRNRDSWNWTVGQTMLILGVFPEAKRHRAAVYCAIAGMIMMYGGGVSVLFGLEGRLGALALMIFSALGMGIHRVNREQALSLGKSIGAAAPAVNDQAQNLAWSAFGGHLSSGLKNVTLIGTNALFLLHGTGPLSISDLISHWLF